MSDIAAAAAALNMVCSPEIGELAKVLPAAQKAIAKVGKDAANPHFNSKYASLTEIADAIVPAMLDHGISVLQPAAAGPGVVTVATVLLHTSGQFLGAVHTIPVSRNDAQGFGSALTYARRQALQSLLTVAPAGEDDDGEGSVGRGKGRPPIPLTEPPKDPPRPPLAERTGRLLRTIADVKTHRDLVRVWDNSKELRAELSSKDKTAAHDVQVAYDARQADLIEGAG